MTVAQLHAARMLIPGAYEPNAPPHRATRPTLLPGAPFQEVRAYPAAAASTPSVVAAPARPTTRLGLAAAILGDLLLCTGLIFAVALVPALVLYGIKAAAELILDTLGRH